jgi:hypothetical protein
MACRLQVGPVVVPVRCEVNERFTNYSYAGGALSGGSNDALCGGESSGEGVVASKPRMSSSWLMPAGRRALARACVRGGKLGCDWCAKGSK